MDGLAALMARILGIPDRPVADSLSDPRGMARLASFMWISGSTLALVALVLPQPPGTEFLGVYITIGLGYVAGLLTFLAAPRTPELVLPFSVTVGTVLVCVGTYFSGQPESVYAMLLIWVGLFAFQFLGRRNALIQTAFAGACYAAVLIARHTPSGAERWLITIGVILTAGLWVGMLRTHADGLFSDLERAVAELTKVARTDPLTGLLNRRGFAELIERELGRMHDSGGSFCVLVSDLDHFKRINDNFGHAAGDGALLEASKAIQRAVRTSDAVARLGGEEFAAVLPDSDPQEAYLVAERMRIELQEGFVEQGLALTISSGISMAPRDGRDGDSLMRAADDAMYKAKRLGRNRTVVHLPGAEVALETEPVPEGL